jgi:hypothetical protein
VKIHCAASASCLSGRGDNSPSSFAYDRRRNPYSIWKWAFLGALIIFRVVGFSKQWVQWSVSTATTTLMGLRSSAAIVLEGQASQKLWTNTIDFDRLANVLVSTVPGLSISRLLSSKQLNLSKKSVWPRSSSALAYDGYRS